MLSSNPLTASIDIQKAASTFKQLTEVTNITVNKKIDNIANDVVRISSSIGRARTLGNLTNSQATSLYNKIAALL